MLAGPAPASAQQPYPGACVSPGEADRALSATLISTAPAELCAPVYQIVEIRNLTDAPLDQITFYYEPPLGRDRMSFAGQVFELSENDGATWRRIGAPSGTGALGDPLIWTAETAGALARLGPAGASTDSVLLRWRAAYGQDFGDGGGRGSPLASSYLSAGAVDQCGRSFRTPRRSVALPIRQPLLTGALTGRNVARGGGFSSAVAAAPGDEIEWRVELDNLGSAMAREVRVRLSDPSGGGQGDGVIDGLVGSDGAPLGPEGVAAVRNLVEGGRRIVRFRETAGPVCRRRPTSLDVSWGCRPAPEGLLSALTDASAGAEAALITEVDPRDLILTQAISGLGGAERPGEFAELRLSLRNAGPPLFDPVIELSPPAGYVVDDSAPIDFFGQSRGVAGARFEGGEDRRGVIRLVGRADGRPALDPGDRAQIGLRLKRVRPTAPGSRSAAIAVARFVDGCEVTGETPPSVLDVTPRQPALSLVLASDEGALVGGAGERKRYTAVIENTGDEAARDLRLRLDLGGGWRAEAPAGCAPIAGAGGLAGGLGDGLGGGQFDCAVARALAPGRTARFPFELVSGGEGALEFQAAALSFPAPSASSDGAAQSDPSPLASAEAAGGAVGFSIRQRGLRAGGLPRDPATPLDLGERMAIEVAARWAGVGSQTVDGAAVSLSLPEALAYRGSAQVDDAVTVETVLPPRSAAPGGGQILWSLAPIKDDAEFVARVFVEAVEPSAPIGAAAAPTAQAGETRFVEAAAVFSAGGRAYGVDPLTPGPEAAEPLAIGFRRPDISLRFDVAREGEDAPAPRRPFGPIAPGAGDSGLEEDAILPRAGDRLLATLTLENAGGAPGYLDWLTLDAPSFVTIAPIGSDGIDNDGDGAVDERGEGAGVLLETVADADGAAASRLRWLAPYPGRVGPGAAQRLPARSTTALTLLITTAESLAPSARGALAINARYGPTPFAAGSAERPLLQLTRPVRTPPIEGFLVLSATSVGGDLSPQVRADERVEHRLSLRIPAGAARDVTARLAFPPAVGAPDFIRYGFGPGVDCDRVRPPEVAADPATGGSVMTWRLGDCAGAIDASANARVARLDLTAVMRDADPAAPAEIRAAWRRPEIVASIATEDRPDPAVIGRSALRITGPALRLETALIDDSGAPLSDDVVFDAGDAFLARLRLTNVGDAPAAVAALAAREDGQGALSAASNGALNGALNGAILCAETIAPSPPVFVSAAPAVDGDCGARLTFAPEDAGKPVLPVGAVREVVILSRLGPAAPIGGAARLPFVVEARAAEATAPPLSTRAALAIPIAKPAAPRIDASIANAAVAAEAGDDLLVIGDQFRLRGDFRLPEGRGAAEIALWVRLISPSGRPIDGDALGFDAATAVRGADDILSSTNPGGAFNAPPGVRVTADEAVSVTTEAEGWRRIALPLGLISAAQPKPVLGERALFLEAVLTLSDAAAARSGRIVEAKAALTIGGETLMSAPIQVGRIAEPFVDLAGWIEPTEAALGPLSGRAAMLRAVACNRGAAPAYGVSLSAAAPEGWFFLAEDAAFRRSESLAQAPSRGRRGAAPALDAADFGAVRGDVGSLSAVGDGVGALEPSRCVALSAPMRAAGDSGGVSGGLSAAVDLSTGPYRARLSRGSPGRRYPPSRARAALRAAAVAIEIAPPSQPTPLEHRFAITVDAGPGAAGARAKIAIAPLGPAEWTLRHDLDADGRISPRDPIWRDGAPLSAEGRLALIAVARRPAEAARAEDALPPLEAEAAPPARADAEDGAILRAFAVAGGASFQGARAIAFDAGAEGVEARRSMAVDRDCDGELEDEITQDAVFSARKDAAPGECVIMRIRFHNAGDVSIEDVVVEDRVFDGASFVSGTARFFDTPFGLVASGVSTPAPDSAGADAAIRFAFAGSLAPRLSGAVEYRLRLGAR